MAPDAIAAAEAMSLPLCHRSDLRVLGPLPGVDGLPLEDETPVLGADRAYARAHGGPITRAFVDTLPADPAVPVIIDSSLAWVGAGLAHVISLGGQAPFRRHRSPPQFMHEPFPGVDTGVRRASNRDLAALHRLCVLGLDCTPEVAVGEFSFTEAADAEAFWLPAESLDAREAEIEARLADGRLTRAIVPVGVVVELGWGALLRSRPATRAGFQLILRATIGDPRPPVNVRRNQAMV